MAMKQARAAIAFYALRNRLHQGFAGRGNLKDGTLFGAIGAAAAPAAHSSGWAAAATVPVGVLGRFAAAVALLTAQAIAINRLAGIDYPLWTSKAAKGPS